MTDKEKLALQHLARFVSEHKKNFIDKVLSVRTRHVTIVMEDIYQSQNASAVIRTAECMGLQDVHIIEQQSKYDINPRVLKGSDRKSTRLNSSHVKISYAVFCLKKKTRLQTMECGYNQ